MGKERRKRRPVFHNHGYTRSSQIQGRRCKRGCENEPWVLATKVDQCFFITDPTNPSRVVVRRGKRNIIGMDGVANEQDFDQYGDPKIEDDDDYDAATYITRRKRTTLPKKGSPFERRNIKVSELNYSTATKKGKKIVKR